MEIKCHHFASEADWLNVLTRDFSATVHEALSRRPRAHVALAGGITPLLWYQRLNRQPLPWEQIEWWPGDERWALPTDPSSNEKMIHESLGKDRTEFAAHFHSWHLAGEPREAARRMEEALRREMGEKPSFDLMALGLGPDGHTASLFPGTTALDETRHWAVANDIPQLQTTRLTLTFPVLNRAQQIWFLARGTEKQAVVNKLLSRDTDIPAARVRAPNQTLYWLTG